MWFPASLILICTCVAVAVLLVGSSPLNPILSPVPPSPQTTVLPPDTDTGGGNPPSDPGSSSSSRSTGSSPPPTQTETYSSSHSSEDTPPTYTDLEGYPYNPEKGDHSESDSQIPSSFPVNQSAWVPIGGAIAFAGGMYYYTSRRKEEEAFDTTPMQTNTYLGFSQPTIGLPSAGDVVDDILENVTASLFDDPEHGKHLYGSVKDSYGYGTGKKEPGPEVIKQMRDIGKIVSGRASRTEAGLYGAEMILRGYMVGPIIEKDCLNFEHEMLRSYMLELKKEVKRAPVPLNETTGEALFKSDLYYVEQRIKLSPMEVDNLPFRGKGTINFEPSQKTYFSSEHDAIKFLNNYFPNSKQGRVIAQDFSRFYPNYAYPNIDKSINIQMCLTNMQRMTQAVPAQSNIFTYYVP